MYATEYNTIITGQTGGEGVRVPAPRPPVDSNDVTEALDHRPQAVRTARHAAQAVLDEWQVASDAVLLVVSELVTNAVEHAAPPLALHLHRERTGSRVWVGVTDGGPVETEGTRTTSRADDEHGPTIVDTLAETHGTRTHPSGTTHWARIAA
ncbi:ATP-binding protein [Streptomyces sp. NBC_01077]|uniref:ATP-binding protein n=1 Tax=Streptomyces sp. NBC_01077 TaxID=2903746 RepID=UPI00387098F1|nr:ATP-binding protein [Streptomyces sp. NBC_01077]WSV43765.1 ATP-binding protein [Streptomyces sp. NBC_01077]